MSQSSDDERDALGVSLDLVELPTIKAATITSINFDGLLDTPLQLHEDLAKGCGGQLWPAGIRLAKYLLQSKRDAMKDCSIVELGSGGGLTGLAIAAGCHTQQVLHITDQEAMFNLMLKNIELNKLTGRVKASIYDWGLPTPAGLPQQPDVILAADCVYFEPAFEPLLQTLMHLIGDTTTCYFCFKKRRRADLNFMKNARKMFHVKEITDDAEYAIYARQNVHLYTITKKATTNQR